MPLESGVQEDPEPGPSNTKPRRKPKKIKTVNTETKNNDTLNGEVVEGSKKVRSKNKKVKGQSNQPSTPLPSTSTTSTIVTSEGRKKPYMHKKPKGSRRKKHENAETEASSAATDKEFDRSDHDTDDLDLKNVRDKETKMQKRNTPVSLFSIAGLDIEIVPADIGDKRDEKLPQPVKEDKDIRNRNTWSVESFEATTERVFQGKYLLALRPYFRTLICLGRYPLSAFMKDVRDANPYYQIRWCSPRAIWCLLISLINFILCLWTWIACILFFADTIHGPDHNKTYWRYLRSHEMILIKRNITTFIIFHMCIFHLFVTHLLIFYKKTFTCQYSTLWLESVELLRLHCVTGIRLFFWWKLGLFIFFTVIVIGFFVSGYIQLCQGTGAMIGTLLLRIFDPKIVMKDAKHFRPVRIFGIVVFIYVFMLAKFSAIQFAVRCRLINNLVEVWNRRFRVCLHGTIKEQKNMIRSTRAYLFKDHCVWVNILEGANQEIFLQIESFFVMVCVSFVFELHHMVRALSGEEFDLNRRMDIYAATALIVIDLYYFYNAGIEAGLLTETVSESYDIIREKGVLSREVAQEVTFMMSLQLSLMGSTDERGMGLVGWEFVYYSKTYMLIAIGFSCTVFVMLWQYQQPIDQYIGNDIYCDRVNVGQFLDRVMNGRKPFSDKTHLCSCNNDYVATYEDQGYGLD